MRTAALTLLLATITACDDSSGPIHTSRGNITDIVAESDDSTVVSAVYHPVAGANNWAYIFAEDDGGTIDSQGVEIVDDGPSIVRAVVAPPVGYRLRFSLLLVKRPHGGRVLEVAADTAVTWGRLDEGEGVGDDDDDEPQGS